MQWIDTLVNYIQDFSTYRTTIGAGDILEILIIAFLVYYILAWMKTTRAWQLLKGLIVIFVVLLFAYIMDMSTILWLAENLLGFAAVAIVVVMQPELRHALEELGKKNFLPSGVFPDSSKREQDLFSEKTINEIVKASFEMGRAKTGALIVIEQNESLRDYERTGINVDGIVTNQLLINIFEHNTPLHDGAVIIRGNRITSATCYLPLSDNLDLSKELGTRHRAGVGVSEATDSLTIIVSEETGKVSVAYEGRLERGLSSDELKARLMQVLNRKDEEKPRGKHIWKGRSKAKNEKENLS